MHLLHLYQPACMIADRITDLSLTVCVLLETFALVVACVRENPANTGTSTTPADMATLQLLVDAGALCSRLVRGWPQT